MAIRQATRHGTLSADTVATVTISSLTAVESIEVMNVTGTDELYYTTAVAGATAATPTVAGNDTVPLPKAEGASRVQEFTKRTEPGAAQVKIISNGTDSYSVIVR